MQATLTDPGRRRVLAGGTGAALLGAGLPWWPGAAFAQGKPLPPYADWKNADKVIVHSPTTIETERAALTEHLVTPAALLYVRNNVLPPDASVVADPLAWQVSIEGVGSPRALSVRDLQALGREDVTMVLQCSGNGRAFFPHKPSGTPWTVGAAGNVTWGGVPLKAVVERLGGVAAGMKYVTSTGGETIPPGIDPLTVKVERSVPIDALEHLLLAWELNGQPIPLAHGGPLRLITPGYVGVNNVKYVKRVAFTPAQSDANIQVNRYRMVPLGAKPGPQYPSLWEMDVKSFVTVPDGMGTVPAGSVLIRGVAFGGMDPARKVELTVDGGKTWSVAPFIGADMGRFAWREFARPMRLEPGRYEVASRATDARGHQQPKLRNENRSGYVNNSWLDHAVQITVV